MSSVLKKKIFIEKNNIGERIKKVRLANNLTLQKFADSTGYAHGFLSEIERGKKPPSDTLIILLSSLYEINKHWLLTGEGEMYAESAPRHAESEYDPMTLSIAEVLKHSSTELRQEVQKFIEEKKLIAEILAERRSQATGTGDK